VKTIKKLDKQLINKIAAGEVVERPLSIIKELTENSIDAGAGDITIEIKDGGLSYIRVTDNGSGIAPDQISLAFEQHATSKIADIDDLTNIKTLGFRGEALASISAVSHVEMVTKKIGAIAGIRTELHGGTIADRKEIGCAEGTTITVTNLFYNTPARLKFLKKPPQEAAYITDLVQRLAIGYPNKSFRYIQNGKTVATTNGNGDLKTVIYNLHGKETAKGLIEITQNATLHGFVGKPEIARGSRSGENFFINGRYVKSDIMQTALEDAFRGRLPVGKFPVCVLYLTVPEDEVDVNVHPTKMEVRFANDREIYNNIIAALNKTLGDNILIPEIQQNPKKYPAFNLPPQPKPQQGVLPGILQQNLQNMPNEKLPPSPKTRQIVKFADFTENANFANKVETLENSMKMDLKTSVTMNTTETAKFTVNPEKTPQSQLVAAESTSKSEPKLEPKSAPKSTAEFSQTPANKLKFTLMGQIFGTYWLAATADDLFLIDQHAAHERVLYEEILHKLKNETHKSQPLLEPLKLQLSPQEIAATQEYSQFFDDFGFQFELSDISKSTKSTPKSTPPKTPVTLNVTAVPLILSDCLDFSFFAELLEKLQTGAENTPLRKICEEVAKIACKKAVKANDKTTEPEIITLITRILELDNPYSCPHGRPTIVKLTKTEIAKMFNRT